MTDQYPDDYPDDSGGPYDLSSPSDLEYDPD